MLLLGFISSLLLFTSSAAAATLSITGIISALHLSTVQDINSFITLDSLATNLISVNFDSKVSFTTCDSPLVKNPLIVELTIDRIVSSAGLNGTVFAQFDYTFTPPPVIPLLGNSGTVNNVLLTQGAIAALNIIPFGVLDLINTDVSLRALTVAGLFGVPVPLDDLQQSSVPTKCILLDSR